MKSVVAVVLTLLACSTPTEPQPTEYQIQGGIRFETPEPYKTIWAEAVQCAGVERPWVRLDDVRFWMASKIDVSDCPLCIVLGLTVYETEKIFLRYEHVYNHALITHEMLHMILGPKRGQHTSPDFIRCDPMPARTLL